MRVAICLTKCRHGGIGDAGTDGCNIRNVEQGKASAQTIGTEFSRGLGACRAVDVSKHDRCAVLGDAARARQSNAASGARNECDLADERASGLSHQRLCNPIGAGCRDRARVP